nr:hypothetical protein [Tanacetum cinerariifolium]
MIDEYFKPPPSVVSLTISASTLPITYTTGVSSSTTIDQDVPSPKHPDIHKCLDFTPHLITFEARLEKLKYAAKGERKPTFGMPIPKAILRGGIKVSQVYVEYVTKYPQAKITPKHGMGKGLMRKGVVSKPKKKKNVALKRSKSISAEENILSDPNEALEYAKQVSIYETEKQEKVHQAKHKYFGIVLERQVNKEVDKGYDHLKVKLKAKVQQSPEADLLLNLKKQIKSSRDSSNDSNEFANDDKNDSERDSDHDEIQTEATTMTVSPTLETIHETSEQVTKTLPATPPTKTKTKKQQVKNLVAKVIKKENDSKKAIMLRLINLKQQNRTDFIDESAQANVLNEEKSKKRRRRGAGESSSKKSKDQDDEPPHFERGNDAEKPRQDDEQVHEDHEVQNNEIPKELEEYKYKDGFVTFFGKLVKKIFKKDKITKEDVEGLTFELLKGTCKNSIELEYNINQCTLALIDKIYWINLESGDRFHKNLSKLLPLIGPPGKKRIPVSYFFNHDLEYLMHGTKENMYALSVTKTKDARYKDEGIKEMIPSLWSRSIQKYNRDKELGIYHCIKVNKKFGYTYLDESVVTKTNEKEYKFCEVDFPNLDQNDIEDMFRLKNQNKVRSIKGIEEFDLINALRMYICRIVIKKRVKDVQMGVESYYTKLNLTKLQLMEGYLHHYNLYTILNHLLYVV